MTSTPGPLENHSWQKQMEWARHQSVMQRHCCDWRCRSAHLGAAADQSHGPDGVGSLSGVRILQVKHRLVDGVWAQVGLPVHREVIQQGVHHHQAVGHAGKHSGQTLEGRDGEISRTLDQIQWLNAVRIRFRVKKSDHTVQQQSDEARYHHSLG